MVAPYLSHNAYLKRLFGEKVHRISIDAGFACPHRAERRGPHRAERRGPHRAKRRGGGGCLFCDSQGSGTGAFDEGRTVSEQMARAIDRLGRSGVRRFIAYFQAFTNTLAPIDALRSLYREACGFDGVVGLSVSTRPDAIADEVLDLLASFAPGGREGRNLDVWTEIGLQSACDATLERLNRGHDVACFSDAVERATAQGIKTASHVILGLPGEGPDEMSRTAALVASLPLEGVKLHHLYITKDSMLAAPFERGEIKTLSLDEYIPLAVDFLRRIRPDQVVMRLCGSAAKGKLLSPIWKTGAGEVATRIATKMESEGFSQGDLLE